MRKTEKRVVGSKLLELGYERGSLDLKLLVMGGNSFSNTNSCITKEVNG